MSGLGLRVLHIFQQFYAISIAKKFHRVFVQSSRPVD